jgi:hypothetical protein
VSVPRARRWDRPPADRVNRRGDPDVPRRQHQDTTPDGRVDVAAVRPSAADLHKQGDVGKRSVPVARRAETVGPDQPQPGRQPAIPSRAMWNRSGSAVSSGNRLASERSQNQGSIRARPTPDNPTCVDRKLIPAPKTQIAGQARPRTGRPREIAHDETNPNPSDNLSPSASLRRSVALSLRRFPPASLPQCLLPVTPASSSTSDPARDSDPSPT